MDLTRLQARLNPDPDGESAVRHRSGIVDAVNSDGTVDLDLGGVVVPDVSVLGGAGVTVGQVVQVAAWAGDLLVLGSTADSAGGVGWTPWTPSYTNLNVGTTGATIARYTQVGKTVYFYWEATLNGTGISVGSVTVSLPVTAAGHYTTNASQFGVCSLFESGVANYSGVCLSSSTTTFAVRYWNTAVANVVRSIPLSSTAPFTWGAADKLIAQGFYEAA